MGSKLPIIKVYEDQKHEGIELRYSDQLTSGKHLLGIVNYIYRQ